MSSMLLLLLFLLFLLFLLLLLFLLRSGPRQGGHPASPGAGTASRLKYFKGIP